PANIAAQRAFFNYLLTEGINRAPQPAITAPAIVAGQTATLTATITGGDGTYNYQWISTNGGVFSTPAGTATSGSTITTQYLLTSATDTVRLVVTDTPCGRQSIASINLSRIRLPLTHWLDLTQVGFGCWPAISSQMPRMSSATCCNQSSIWRNRKRRKSTRRPPRRGSARCCQCSQTHTLRRTRAMPTYSSRSSGSRVHVRIRAWCSCR